MDQDHFLREFEQIALIQKRINETFTSNIPKNKQIKQILDYIESVNDFTSSTIDGVLSNNIVITQNSLSIINHELKTPLVPIMAYAKMLMQEKFGPLNQEQKEKLDIINKNTNQLKQKIELLLDRNTLGVNVTNDQVPGHQVKELEQQKLLLEKINGLLVEKERTSESKIQKLTDKLNESEHSKNELAQKTLVLNKTVQAEEQKIRRLDKKNIIIIMAAAMVAGAGFTAYSVYVVGVVGQQYQIANLGNMPTSYVIQNLKGDTIDTWLSWRLVSGSTLHIGITNAEKYPEKIPLIKETILSEESIEIDDSLLHKGLQGTTSKYYIGWQGALKQASTSTEFYIPSKLEVIDSAKGEGDITIHLTDERNGDGYTGFTKSIADESQNQILKSTITIYDVGNLSDEQFKTILRHEFGHALGLAHSTAPEDLMAPTIQTAYPYISECVIDTIVKLYDGGKNSQVICEK